MRNAKAEHLSIYSHKIRGEDSPFYIGSGRPNRPGDFKRGVDWEQYVVARLGEDPSRWMEEIEISLVRQFDCEGEMRYVECMMAAEQNTLGNRIGAARASVDMLTGLLKGAKPCNCSSDDCRRKKWLSMAPDEQDQEMLTQLSLANRNRRLRGEKAIPVEQKMRTYRSRRDSGHHWFRG